MTRNARLRNLKFMTGRLYTLNGKEVVLDIEMQIFTCLLLLLKELIFQCMRVKYYANLGSRNKIY